MHLPIMVDKEFNQEGILWEYIVLFLTYQLMQFEH